MKTALRASLLLLALHAGFAIAQAQPPADEKPLPAKALIAFRRSPLADLVPNAKDAGLRNALGMLEARSSPTLVGALDGALKSTPVELVELRLAEGLGGKAVASLWGNQHDVEVALELAEARLARGPLAGASTTLIANAHPEVARVLSAGTRYFKEQFG